MREAAIAGARSAPPAMSLLRFRSARVGGDVVRPEVAAGGAPLAPTFSGRLVDKRAAESQAVAVEDLSEGRASGTSDNEACPPCREDDHGL